MEGHGYSVGDDDHNDHHNVIVELWINNMITGQEKFITNPGNRLNTAVQVLRRRWEIIKKLLKIIKNHKKIMHTPQCCCSSPPAEVAGEELELAALAAFRLLPRRCGLIEALSC